VVSEISYQGTYLVGISSKVTKAPRLIRTRCLLFYCSYISTSILVTTAARCGVVKQIYRTCRHKPFVGRSGLIQYVCVFESCRLLSYTFAVCICPALSLSLCLFWHMLNTCFTGSQVPPPEIKISNLTAVQELPFRS
jgi:hypothetical protein